MLLNECQEIHKKQDVYTNSRCCYCIHYVGKNLYHNADVTQTKNKETISRNDLNNGKNSCTKTVNYEVYHALIRLYCVHALTQYSLLGNGRQIVKLLYMI